MVALSAALFLAGLTSPLQQRDLPQPILAFQLDGSVVAPCAVRWRPNTKVVPVPRGVGLEISASGGWEIPDNPKLALTNAFTISVWLKPSDYVSSGPGAQILFRGDDRSGYDPFGLTIHNDGRIYLLIQNEKNEGQWVACEIPLNVWTHILASFSAKTGELKLFKNGTIVDQVTTPIRPFARLLRDRMPGLGVGNVQSTRLMHDQPYHGIMADLRLYDRELSPKNIEFTPLGWDR